MDRNFVSSARSLLLAGRRECEQSRRERERDGMREREKVPKTTSVLCKYIFLTIFQLPSSALLLSGHAFPLLFANHSDGDDVRLSNELGWMMEGKELGELRMEWRGRGLVWLCPIQCACL